MRYVRKRLGILLNCDCPGECDAYLASTRDLVDWIRCTERLSDRPEPARGRR